MRYHGLDGNRCQRLVHLITYIIKLQKVRVKYDGILVILGILAKACLKNQLASAAPSLAEHHEGNEGFR